MTLVIACLKCEPRHNQVHKKCAPSEDSDQPTHKISLCQAHEETVGLGLHIKHQQKLLTEHSDVQADQSMLGKHNFICFVAFWLNV